MHLIDLKTLGKEMSLSVYTLRKFIKMGMPYYRVGKKFLVDSSEVKPWFARHFRPDADSNDDVLDQILNKALARADRQSVD